MIDIQERDEAEREARLCAWAGQVAAGLVVAYQDRDGASETAVRAWDVAEALEETRRHRAVLRRRELEKESRERRAASFA